MDRSNGYESIAREFAAIRSKSIGVAVARKWSESMPSSSQIIDIGCGNGVPITQTIIGSGHSVFAIDASESMIRAFKRNFPDVPARCEAIEDSDFFAQKFDGVIAIGVIFLLERSLQIEMIQRVGKILPPGGQFLFTSPAEVAKWYDNLTGRRSESLGKERYIDILAANDMELISTCRDEGNQFHYFARKK